MKKGHKKRTYSITIDATARRHEFVLSVFNAWVRALELNNFAGISFIGHTVVEEEEDL